MSSGSEPMGGSAVFSAPWISRVTAVGILLAILLAIYSVLVSPLVAAYSEINGAIAQSTELLARYQRVTAQYPDLKKLLDRVNADHTASGVYLPGDTDALAAAELQEIVNSKVETNGAQVRSVQILPTKEDGDFRRVGVRIQLTATIAAVARILYAFEAGGTFLFVDNLEVSNRKNRRRAGEQADPELLVRLDLTGYVRPEATK
jgi:general secretion pathway protein M